METPNKQKEEFEDYIAGKRKLFKESGAWQDITLDEVRYGSTTNYQAAGDVI